MTGVSVNPVWASVSLLLVGWMRSTTATSASDQMSQVCSDYWHFKLREFPTYATNRGIHDHDHLMENYTMETFSNREKEVRQLLSQLDKIDASQLSLLELQNMEVLRADLTYYVEGYKWRMYGNLNPINFLEGIHRPPHWISAMEFNQAEDYDKYHARLRAVPRQIDQIIELMSEAIRLNRTNHNVSMALVPEQIRSQIDTPTEESAWYIPYSNSNLQQAQYNETEWEDIRAEARKRILTNVILPMKKLYNFTTQVYMPNTRREYGVWSLDSGRQYYQACLRFHLSTNSTAEEVHETGLREVARIKKRMEEVMKGEGFNGSLPAFFKYLREHRREDFYDRTADQLLDSYRTIIYDRINPRISTVIRSADVLKYTISVKPMPYDGPSGSYGSSTFYANLRRPETRPSFTMMALSLHEANPGHHLQTMFAKQQDLPEFRRHLWSSKYYAVPFNFPWHTAYTEGWGLYAEYLGEEMGCYNTTALELFGRFSTEIFRACRLVIDTGIHAFGMSREEAIEYLADHAAIPRSQIEREIDRYITWPGQACAYKIGELKIWEIRREAEKALQDDFDVRDFNDQILKVGRVPMGVLKAEIDRWVKKTLQAQISSGSSQSMLCHRWGTTLLIWLIIYNFSNK